MVCDGHITELRHSNHGVDLGAEVTIGSWGHLTGFTSDVQWQI